MLKVITTVPLLIYTGCDIAGGKTSFKRRWWSHHGCLWLLVEQTIENGWCMYYFYFEKNWNYFLTEIEKKVNYCIFITFVLKGGELRRILKCSYMI